MFTAIFKGRAARGVTAIGVAGAAALAMMPGGVPAAHADPRQLTNPVIAVGSDTIQDITNALAGVSNNIDYTPLHSDQGSGRLQITSWDAVPPSGGDGNTITCISPKAPGASFNRPNGSSQGRRALSRAIDGGNYGTSLCGSSTGKPVSGLVDMARSSAGPSGTTGALTYIPIGRDGVSYAYYTTGTATAVTDLTKAELQSIYNASAGSTGTPITRGSTTTNIIPCDIQSGSGTKAFWEGALAIGTNDDVSGTFCNNANIGTSSFTPSGSVEENQPLRLKQKGDAIGGNNEFIIAMSAGSFIAQNNGVSPSNLATGVDIGGISNDGNGVNLGRPYTAGPPYAPVSGFYSNATFGRNVYFVFDTNRVGPSSLGNAGLKQLFVSTTTPAYTAIVCQTGTGSAQERVNKFGFLTPTDCGNNTNYTGDLLTGSL